MKAVLNILKHYKIMLILIVFILSIINIQTNKTYIDTTIIVLELIYNLL